MPVAFPGAEGFGANSIGGRGGAVIPVTNLNNSGAGSFRTAVTTAGARTVVFRVSGTIQIASQITINDPFLTIAGHTSPGGVQIRGTPGTATGISFGSGFHDLVMRHMRVRIGGNEANDDGESLLVFSSSAAPNHCYNMLFDHCSIEWGHDGIAMCYGNWDLVTWQWCLIAMPICDVNQDNGNGREGMHIGGNTLDMTNHGRISVHHCAFLHAARRVPNMTRARIFDFRNNYIYNWLFNNGGRFGQSAGGFNWSAFGNIVNNHWQVGVDSSTTNRALVVDNAGGEFGGTKVYTSGNWGPLLPTGGADDWVLYRAGTENNTPALESTYRTETPFAVPSVTTQATSAVKALVLANVGANKPSRDSTDSGYIAEANAGTGTLAAFTYAGGPWPTLTGTLGAPTDTDADGMPDAWELAHNLNPNDAADRNNLDVQGYTELERYHQSLAGDIIDFSTGGAGSPQFVQVSAPAESITGGPLVPTLNNVRAGSSLIYVVSTRGTGPTVGAPSGYTEIVETTPTTNNQRMAAGQRHEVAAGTHSPSITVAAGNTARAYLMEWANIQAAVDSSVTVNNALATANSGVVTPPSGSALILAACGHAAASGSTTITPNAGWNQIVTNNDVTTGRPMNIQWLTGVTADTEGTWTFNTIPGWTALAIAFPHLPFPVPSTRGMGMLMGFGV